jgi:hypothetical protein
MPTAKLPGGRRAYLHRSKRPKGTRRATTLMIGVGGPPGSAKKESKR